MKKKKTNEVKIKKVKDFIKEDKRFKLIITQTKFPQTSISDFTLRPNTVKFSNDLSFVKSFSQL